MIPAGATLLLIGISIEAFYFLKAYHLFLALQEKLNIEPNFWLNNHKFWPLFRQYSDSYGDDELVQQIKTVRKRILLAFLIFLAPGLFLVVYCR
jgi:hypothetical protein